jgi:hypothetical protein
LYKLNVQAGLQYTFETILGTVHRP